MAIRYSNMVERWQTVPAPVQAPSLVTYGTGMDGLTWSYPVAAGQYEITNALVDSKHRVGAWSQPFSFTADLGWAAYVGCWNQPVVRDMLGVLWKIKCISKVQNSGPYSPLFEAGDERLFSLGYYAEGLPPLAAVAWSAPNYKLKVLHYNNNKFNTASMRFGGSNQGVATPPVVIIASVPMVPLQIAYCWVTHKGETALSPALAINPAVLPENYLGFIRCRLGAYGDAERLPFGALGFHVYVNLNGAGWKRIPAPHCLGTASVPNDWLFPLGQYQFDILRMQNGAPSHSAAVSAQSWLDKLSVAMYDSTEDIIVDAATVTPYCPLIDEFKQWGTETLKMGRRIASESGGRWKLAPPKSFTVNDVIYDSHAVYWPAIVVQNIYSTWVGVQMSDLHNYNSTGIKLSGFSGGQCFGNRFLSCGFVMYGTDPSNDLPGNNITYGLSIEEYNFGGDHSASELVFDECGFNAGRPITIEHDQSANIMFSHCYSVCYGAGNYQLAANVIDAAVPVRFLNGFFTESPNNTIWKFGRGPKLHVDGIWVDQGCVSFIDQNDYQNGDYVFENGKINFWGPGGEKQWLARVFNSSQPIKLRFEHTLAALNNGNLNLYVSNTAYRRTQLIFYDTPISDLAILREPNQQQFADAVALWTPEEGKDYAFLHPQQVGIRLPLPSRTYNVPGQTIFIQSPQSFHYTAVQLPDMPYTIPSEDIYLNTLTGNHQNVQQEDWWS